jgi:hypothetical protein
MSQVLSRYPQYQPGLCGRRECPRICSRVEHCPAGLRRSRARLAAQAVRRFTVAPHRRQLEVCAEVRKAGLCPGLCSSVGGCFLPRQGDHPSEARRKAFRVQKAMDLLVKYRQGGVSCK